MKLRSIVLGIVVLGLPPLAWAADTNKPAPKAAPVEGTLVDMTKDQRTAGGTITVKVNGNPMTFQVTESTRFEFFDGVSRRGANFLSEHVGKQVAVLAKPASDPPEADFVQILLPRPKAQPPSKPQPPKPAWVSGTVSELAGGHVTLKLPNRTPPPPVLGAVANVTLDDKNGTGTLTVMAQGQKRTFTVNSATSFQKRGVKHKHWSETFLSIAEGETVQVFPRYGAPGLAAAVDILLPGATPKPAVPSKDSHVKFQLQPATRYEMVRDGQHKPAAPAALAVGARVDVLPPTAHSHVAGAVRIQAPPSIHGRLMSAGPAGLQVKVHQPGGGGRPATEQTRSVPVNGATLFQMVQGNSRLPASAGALKPGQHLVILPAAAPPHVAEVVLIHHNNPKPVPTPRTKTNPKKDHKPKK
jgi:hypothetical protein